MAINYSRSNLPLAIENERQVRRKRYLKDVQERRSLLADPNHDPAVLVANEARQDAYWAWVNEFIPNP